MLLLTAYGRGGLPRFRQDSAAAYLAQVESLREPGRACRRCPPLRPRLPARLARGDRRATPRAEGLPLHVHADEQPREIEECLAEHGVRPIELLARTGCLGPRTTVVHATHASDAELDLLAEAGARVCLCPTTEANLGDGFAPVERLCERGIGICIGSDSNVRIDPLEELRELEGIARRGAQAAGTSSRSAPCSASARTRAPPRSASTRGPTSAVDLDHPSLARRRARRRPRRARVRLRGRRLRLGQHGSGGPGAAEGRRPERRAVEVRVLGAACPASPYAPS